MRTALRAALDGFINTANFFVFLLALHVLGVLYGLCWLAFKATHWALFHALALVLWALLYKRIASLSLLVDDGKLP